MKIGRLNKRMAGIAIVCGSIVALNWEVWTVGARGYVDAPAPDRQEGECLKGFSDGTNLYWGHSKVDTQSVRLFLSINWFPRGFHGGTTLADRAEYADVADVQETLRLERRGNHLVVNGVVKSSGETYERKQFHWAFRLWMLPSTLAEITNQGVFHCLRTQEEDHAIDALYVRGRIKEGWTLNPTGPVSLVIGLRLIIKRQSKLAKERNL